MGAFTIVLSWLAGQRWAGSRAAEAAARLAVLLLVLAAPPLHAQEPVPRDTAQVPQDTAVVPIPPEQVAEDTLPATPEEAADTLRPAPNLPVFGRAPARGFGEGRWEWDRTALQRWHGVSLFELLEQVPGLLVTRTGWSGQPAGVAAFGLGGGRLRVFLDGFELDPLASATLDMQQLALVDLDAVRVERDLGETRIELFTFRLPDQRPFSQIEAATGLFNTRILRGLYSTRTGENAVLTVGLDITDTDGWFQQQPSASNSLLARWGINVGARTGVQLEVRQTALERGGTGLTTSANRRDLVLRARSLPVENLTLDAIVGRSSRDPEDGDTINTQLQSVQGVLRGRYELPVGWIGADARLRNAGRTGFVQPTVGLSAEAGLTPFDRLALRGALRYGRATGLGGTEAEGGVRIGPFVGLSLFAQASSGDRVVGIARDTTIVPQPGETDGDETVEPEPLRTFTFSPVQPAMRAVRAGAEWTRWGIRLGAAYLDHDVDLVAPYGLPFDRTTAPVEPIPVRGVEGFGSIPLLYQPLRLEGSYSRWFETGGRPYLPVEHGRVGLSFNQRFYEGNLEPTLRIEAVRRGSAVVPAAEQDRFTAVSTPYTIYNLFLQIRILDVQAFIIWDNITNNTLAADIPDRALGGQRPVYGVRWHFFD